MVSFLSIHQATIRTIFCHYFMQPLLNTVYFLHFGIFICIWCHVHPVSFAFAISRPDFTTSFCKGSFKTAKHFWNCILSCCQPQIFPACKLVWQLTSAIYYFFYFTPSGQNSTIQICLRWNRCYQPCCIWLIVLFVLATACWIPDSMFPTLSPSELSWLLYSSSCSSCCRTCSWHCLSFSSIFYNRQPESETH